MLRLIAAALLVSTLPAAAETPPAIDTSFCQQLVKHTPDADVAYRAGEDVHGRPVVPADLPNTYDSLIPQTITIPLTAKLAQFLALDPASFPFHTLGQSDINLGTLSVRESKVFLNGKPLSDAQQDNLAVLCMKPTSR